MNNEIYSFALKTALNELQNTCPGIKNAFIFNEKGQIVAEDDHTPEKTFIQTMDSLDEITDKAGILGDIDNITFEGSKGRVNVSSINDLYVITVTSKNADKNLINTTSRVLIRTILELLERITPASLKNNSPEPEAEPPTSEVESTESPQTLNIEESTAEDTLQTPNTHEDTEPMLPEAPANQFMVENLGGLFAREDTVRIHNKILTQWQKLYEDKTIEEVEVQTYSGKTVRCKVKPLKNSKHEENGIIQIHPKTRSTLEINVGELVRVKPIIEYGDTTT